ncbi:hypothetical protein ACSSS7_002010 [Eimeria intestinalis]
MSGPIGSSHAAEALAAATGSAAPSARGAAVGAGAGAGSGVGGMGVKRLFSALIEVASRLKYRNVSPQFAANVIKGGTLCRTLWPLLPPLMLLQYMRQCCCRYRCWSAAGAALGAIALAAAAASAAAAVGVFIDAEMYSIECLWATAAAREGKGEKPSPASSFFDIRKPGWTGHWRFQQDLAVIRDRQERMRQEQQQLELVLQEQQQLLLPRQEARRKALVGVAAAAVAADPSLVRSAGSLARGSSSDWKRGRMRALPLQKAATSCLDTRNGDAWAGTQFFCRCQCHKQTRHRLLLLLPHQEELVVQQHQVQQEQQYLVLQKH